MSVTKLPAPRSKHPADAETSRPGLIVGRRYRLRRRLATGRTTEVWSAADERLRRGVVAKRVDHYDVAVREAQAAAAVTHRGVVRVYDLLRAHGGGAWLIMEHLTGASLADILSDERRLCAQEVVHVGQHALEALAAVHAAELVHRDVKPSNLQLTSEGRVVLMDFGLTVAPCTTGGAAVAPIAGSLPYLAPEIVQHGRYGQQSDLFALGMTLFTAVSGVAPMKLGSDRGLPELIALAGEVAGRLTEHTELLDVIFGLIDARTDHRMTIDTALSLLSLRSPTFS